MATDYCTTNVFESIESSNFLEDSPDSTAIDDNFTDTTESTVAYDSSQYSSESDEDLQDLLELSDLDEDVFISNPGNSYQETYYLNKTDFISADESIKKQTQFLNLAKWVDDSISHKQYQNLCQIMKDDFDIVQPSLRCHDRQLGEISRIKGCQIDCFSQGSMAYTGFHVGKHQCDYYKESRFLYESGE